MKFIDIIENPSIENKILFKKECIKRIYSDIEQNGDCWGIKKRQINMILEDIETIKNGNKRNIKTKNK